MATDRRRFLLTGLAGLAGQGVLVPRPVYGRSLPAYLGTGSRPDGRYTVEAVGYDGALMHSLTLPGRGHGIAVRPDGREAVIFARRPGTFAIAVDLTTLRMSQISAAPERHFYGHGVFSADGRTLFATENDFSAGAGKVGVYAAADGYRRVGEFNTYGIGPHEIVRHRETLIVANGGIRTHPDFGRQKLNLDTMRASVVWLEARTGARKMEASLPGEARKLSLRHLACTAGGAVFVAGQWQGERKNAPPLLWRGECHSDRLNAVAPAGPAMKRLRGYIGSISVDTGETFVAVSSPRGGVVQVREIGTGKLVREVRMPDLSGLAAGPQAGQFFASSGTGQVLDVDVRGDPGPHGFSAYEFRISWDNHMVSMISK